MQPSLDYALNVGKEDPDEIIEAFLVAYPNLKRTIMTAARKLEKRGEKRGKELGMQQGEKRGEKRDIEQGMQQQNLKIAKSMLKKDLPISLIKEVTGLNKETIEQITKE